MNWKYVGKSDSHTTYKMRIKNEDMFVVFNTTDKTIEIHNLKNKRSGKSVTLGVDDMLWISEKATNIFKTS